MAAYGSLVSLLNLFERIREYNARNRCFDDQNLMQLKSLEGKVLFLHEFLETYSSGGRREAEPLEAQIAYVILDSQDLIESRIVSLIHHQNMESSESDDQYIQNMENSESDVDLEDSESDYINVSHIADDIRALCLTSSKKADSTDDHHFSQVLQKAIQVVDLIEKEASKIAETACMRDERSRHLTDKSKSDAHDKDHAMIFGDTWIKLMDKLTWRPVALQTIAITGMGGIGRTTLARTVYDNPRTLEHFDV